MKKVYAFLSALLATTIIWAQSPEKMSYQAVVRDNDNHVVINHIIGMQISILQGSASGTAVYVETQSPVTNENGLVSMEIGEGAIVSGDFTTIDWSDGPYFIKTETDPAGGNSYSITGTCQLLSVPYALHAKTAETLTGTITETDPVYSVSQAINITAMDITNLDNLSGVNTGDQDLSGLASLTDLDELATQTALGDSTALVRSEIPDISGLATRIALGDSTALLRSEIPDVSEFITSEIQNLSDVISQNNSANGQIKNVTDPTDAQDAVTKAYVDVLQAQILELQILVGLKVKDNQGNVYDVVTIGTQVWMAENLKATKYNNGTDIPLVTDAAEWSNLTTPGYCWYNNDQATYGDTYGALYNWRTVSSGNLCPTGWHVPTDIEWTILTTFLGGEIIAGGKLKETGTTHWINPNAGATDQYGFTALPGGTRGTDGSFNYMGTGGFYWSSTLRNPATSWYRYLNYNEASVGRLTINQKTGMSVRCIQD